MTDTFERRRLRVYVAGPISSDVFQGVHRGFEAGRRLFVDGLAPFVPHFDALWFLPEGNWNAYLEYDLEYVQVCDAVWRLSGASKGADLETRIAKEHGIPIFYEGTDDADEYADLIRYAWLKGLNGKRRVEV